MYAHTITDEIANRGEATLMLLSAPNEALTANEANPIVDVRKSAYVIANRSIGIANHETWEGISFIKIAGLE